MYILEMCSFLSVNPLDRWWKEFFFLKKSALCDAQHMVLRWKLEAESM